MPSFLFLAGSGLSAVPDSSPEPDSPEAPGPCTIYLLRHGELTNSHLICLNGHHDVGLSAKGLQQAHALAAMLRARPVRAVFSSDLRRTLAGARIVAEPHGLTPTACPELRELSFGEWEGMTVKDLLEKQPGLLERQYRRPDTFRADGGESFQDLHDRVLPKFQEIANAHLGETIVIMAHGGVNRVILGNLLGFPMRNLFRISQEYAAVNRIRFHPGFPRVDLINGAASGTT